MTDKMNAKERSAFIELQIRMFGKTGSPIGIRKIVDFILNEILEAERAAYRQGFDDAKERALQVLGDTWINGSSHTAEQFIESASSGIHSLKQKEEPKCSK